MVKRSALNCISLLTLSHQTPDLTLIFQFYIEKPKADLWSFKDLLFWKTCNVMYLRGKASYHLYSFNLMFLWSTDIIQNLYPRSPCSQ